MMLRKDHRVNYMNDAIGSFDIHCNDLGIVNVDFVFLDFDVNGRALHGRCFGQLDYVARGHATRYDMVGQDGYQLILVFWLEQI